MSLGCSEELFERADTALVRLPATLFCVSLYRFFFFSVCCLFLTLFFLLAFYSLFLLLTVLVMHLDQYIYIKEEGKALDLHTGQAYDHKKNINCTSSETAEFFSINVN